MDEPGYDMVVIGSGPGGEGAAMQGAKNGLRVAVVELAPRIGGACTHRATIPSKALRAAILRLTDCQHHPLLREQGISLNLTLPQLRRSAAATTTMAI